MKRQAAVKPRTAGQNRHAGSSICLVLLMFGLAGFAWADDYDEKPGRGVARISVVNGDVAVRRGDSGDSVAAAVNAPLVVQDEVTTGSGSRAEVQFDWANMIRLASNTAIRLSELQQDRYQVQVARGTVMFRVLRNSDADVEISTPSVSVRPVKKGSYRITVREDGESEITVRSGEAEVFTPRGVERLQSGRTMLARGSPSDPEYQIVRATEWDSWDRWNEDRDRHLERSRGYRYANRSVYGVEDLDPYGDWIYAPPYGWAWAPQVAPGWAPYYYGRWAWIDWYGWSWVSYDPWGWAPYHYGRWFWHGSRWCWWPGGLYSNYYWRPALVAFFGWGHGYGGFNFGLGWGNVGWVPLAPYEPYYPWYGHGYYRGYRGSTFIDNSVNIVNNVNVTNIYRNARVTNAITGVDSSQFGQGRGNMVRVNPNEIQRAGLVKGQLPFVPGRESLRLSDREVRGGNMPRALPDRGFYSRRQPAPVDRVPFEDQRRALERIARRTPEDAGVRGGPGRSPAVESPRSEPARAADRNMARVPAEDRRGGGWRRAEEPRTTEGANREASRGWRRFGEPAARPETPSGSMPRTTEREAVRGGEGSVRSLPVERDRRVGEPGSGGWRRMGEPSREIERREAPSEGSGRRQFGDPGREGPSGIVRQQDSDRRIERTPAESAPRADENIRRTEPSGGWRRFEDRGRVERERSAPEVNERRGGGRAENFRSERSEPRFESPRSEAPRYESPRYESPRIERRESPGWDRRGGEDRIRISPPMVREREAPRFEGSRGMNRAPEFRGGGRLEGGGSRGGEARSMPRGDGGGRSQSGGRGGGRGR